MHPTSCLEKKEVVSAESSVTMVSQDIAIVKQSIVALDTKLQLLHNAILQLQPCNDIASTDGDQPKHHQPLSYAAVVSSDVVKNSVSAAFREHQKVNVDQSCIAVYGFPDEGNDYEQLLDMFSYLNCRCDIVRHSRLGVYSSKSISHVRPIKIELRSASEASTLISRAKYLRNDAFYDGVYINKWLTDEKMRDLKQLRRQCDFLNQKHPSSKKDRKASL